MSATVKNMPVFKFENLKQNEFYDTVMQCVAKIPGFDYRYFFYGGAIRGGKTFVCLYIFHQMAKLYPGSRWYVIREDNPALESTSIPSMEKLIGKKGDDFVWKKYAGNTQVVYKNGSRIFFKSENLQQDKSLAEFLGMEMNGVLLEQMEALSEKLLARVMERLGSWYIDPMPIPLLLGTFNPNNGWVKKLIYDKFIKNELHAPYYYMPALPDDNPFVTDEQWKNWANLDEESQNHMIKGIWTFKNEGNLFAYAFDRERIVKPAAQFKIEKKLPLYTIWDFNVDPMTCLLAQRQGYEWGRVIKEYRLRNSDIYELTERVYNDYGRDYYIVATGDASGRNRTGITKGNKSYTQIIKGELKLSEKQMQFPLGNPSVANTRVLMNSIFQKHKNFFISDECMFLIDDCETVKTDSTGAIDKKNIDPTKTHLLDNLRYFMWNYFRNFIKISSR